MARKDGDRRVNLRGWQSGARPAIRRRMETRGKITQAGGSILAISIIAGTVAGTIVNQPSIGILVGTAAGALLAVLIWLLDRHR